MSGDIDDENSPLITEVNGNESAVFAPDSEYHAVSNYCVHQPGPLCEGELGGKVVVEDDDWTWYFEGKTIVHCPWHRWSFDITKGKNIADPTYTVPRFETTVEDDKIYIDI